MASEPQLTGSVTVRALSLLEAFLPGREQLQISEIARSAGLPLSTAHRLAQDLLIWGALERTSEGLYVIGLKLRQVASMAAGRKLIPKAYLPVMEDLAAATGYIALLAVFEDGLLAFIENTPGKKNVFRPRQHKDLTLTTAAGRTLLAFSSPQLQEHLFSQSITPITSSTVINPESLRRELAEIRIRGHAVTDRQAGEETIGIAVPVWSTSKSFPIAALSLVLPTGAPNIAESIALCKSAAHTIGHSLGSLPND